MLLLKRQSILLKQVLKPARIDRRSECFYVHYSKYLGPLEYLVSTSQLQIFQARAPSLAII
jgi:hypothetical protein